MHVNQCRCTGPECGRKASVRHPVTREPVCTGHYQQAQLHPERPLRPLRRKRRAGDPFTCGRCGCNDRRHYAKGLCELCYMYGLNRRIRRERREAGSAMAPVPA